MDNTQASNSNDLPFTDAARQLLADARVESEHLKHDYVGTEHLVLALTRHPGEAATLARLGIDGEQVRALLAAQITPGRTVPPAGMERPYTSRTKKALSFAAESARDLRHPRVGVEHLVVGLMRERMNIGAEVLHQSGLTLEHATEQAERLAPDGSGS